ncbi:MAG: PEGA domain-containing protein [Pirellulales bacterium]|nr:PEGA domain-containing protein [Pirellulales bacterium]
MPPASHWCPGACPRAVIASHLIRCLAPRLPAGIARWLWLAALLLAASQTGCVQRRLTIRTDPPGALVYVDHIQIGTTPCSSYFTYYGKRRIRIVKDGYETLTVDHRFLPPWYQIPPLDFVSDNFVPFEMRDERSLTFKMTPQRLTPIDQLLERAENLRMGSRIDISNPPVAAPATVLPSQQSLPPAMPAGAVPAGAVPLPTPPPR